MRGVVVLVLLATAACNPRPSELHKLDLPGFSIEAPRYLKPPAELRYNDDEVDAQTSLQRVTILWHAGKPLTDTELVEEIAKSVDTAMADDELEWDPPRSVTIGGQHASRIDGGSDGTSIVTIVQIACGDRSILMTIVGLGIRSFRDRMLESFVCKPIPAEEARLATAAPIAADDPSVFAGYRHLDNELANFSITNDELIATFELEHQATGGAPVDELAQLQEALTAMYGLEAHFTAEGKPDVRDGRTLYRGAAAIDHETTRWAAAVVLRCDPQTVVFGVATMAEPDDRAKAADWLGKMRCSKPGEAPPPLAPAKPDEPVK